MLLVLAFQNVSFFFLFFLTKWSSFSFHAVSQATNKRKQTSSTGRRWEIVIGILTYSLMFYRYSVELSMKNIKINQNEMILCCSFYSFVFEYGFLLKDLSLRSNNNAFSVVRKQTSDIRSRDKLFCKQNPLKGNCNEIEL